MGASVLAEGEVLPVTPSLRMQDARTSSHEQQPAGSLGKSMAMIMGWLGRWCGAQLEQESHPIATKAGQHGVEHVALVELREVKLWTIDTRVDTMAYMFTARP